MAFEQLPRGIIISEFDESFCCLGDEPFELSPNQDKINILEKRVVNWSVAEQNKIDHLNLQMNKFEAERKKRHAYLVKQCRKIATEIIQRNWRIKNIRYHGINN